MTTPASPPSALDTLADLARRTTTIGGKVRVVLRMDRPDVARIDSLARFLSHHGEGVRVSRAAVVRTLAAWGLAEAERLAPGSTMPSETPK